MRFAAAVVSVALLSSACDGDDDDDTGRATAGAGGGSSGSGSPNGGTDASGGSNANGGTNPNGGTAGGSSAGGSCSGAFDAPQTLFEASGADIPSSLSVTGDERELYYWLASGVTVRARDDEASAFGDPVGVPGLESSICTSSSSASLDVSSDGLRLYITCDAPSGPLRVAERADRAASFALSDQPVGMTGTSIALSADELRAFAVASPETPTPVMYERASIAMPFGAGSAVPGIDGTFRHPDPSDDGTVLFGAVASTGTLYRLAVSLRTANGYSAPTSQGLPEPEPTASHLTPTMSADCGSLYFLSLKSGASVTASVMVAQRRLP